MGIVEGLAFTVIAGLIVYNIKRTDDIHQHLDGRMDALNSRITAIELAIPKRKTDHHYYSPNSGIDL